ncbi:MAG: UDP-N-acetylmuramate dehydrogenase [Bacteroidales bacterium]|nr:UDP-N-acetylmuramate dehydrogenase [Bacteroidales bacterium]
MLQISNNFLLKKFNTFNIEVTAKYFAAPQSVDELKFLLNKKEFLKVPKLIIGSGSNMLFTKDINALVIHPEIKGIELIDENYEHVIVKVAAGEVWDNFVAWSVRKGYSGVENLSLIPGRVGAAPVQNIGAYGVELKDVLYKTDALDIELLEHKTFTNQECEFAYRNSIFKNKFKGKYIITYVYFKLSKKHSFQLNYGNLKSELQKIGQINLQTVRDAVINMRRSKLPEPDELPNAGSFFKNPVVNDEKFKQLITRFPDIVYYPADNNKYKIAAAWLIDYCGLKGYRIGNVGVHKNQALVLVNYGNASGNDILNLALYIRQKVFNTFGINLEFEVNVW